MKKGLLVVFAVIFCCGMGYGQTLKTGVLVIGNGNNALGASFQSANSGVKTTLLMETEDFELSLGDAAQQRMASGLELRLWDKLKAAGGIKGSSREIRDSSSLKVDLQKVSALLKSWDDSSKNLTIIRKANWSKLKRSGRGWTVQFNDGKTLKAQMLVYAGDPARLKEILKLKEGLTLEEAGLLNETGGLQWKPLNYNKLIYRTSVASGFSMDHTRANILSLYDLLVPGQEDLIWLNPTRESIAAGQAAGATAAYPVFFKRKDNIPNLKVIQGELINHRLSLIPFGDISPADSSWKAAQFIGLSGFLKGTLTNGEFRFNPGQKVSTLEIKAPIKEFYYKSQIWFDDYTAPEMTIAATLDLVCKVGNKAPVTTLAEVKKKWKTIYRFSTEFDPERVISRREFALLLQDYLNPFNVNIDPTGRVVR
ncbi:hypothetical protein OQX61_16655 [Pedobacter sp. PLR]|uniref:hypothetical protein n=1 Tax=Pedobacter sp. PLR TaxID=2994465 RepID=UPI0022462845|nr:hypothetical protein [Pedobacter sp. PLR]MCX2452909.1 hypothetical protein [Pedobacter sp. PLR]